MNKINNTLFRKLLITAALYLIYRGGFLVLLVPVDMQEIRLFDQILGKGSYSLFALGFLPALSGFFLVEIIFLLIPYLRKIRNNGLEGRKIINNWSLGVSLLIAITQAWALVKLIANSVSSTGLPIIANPTMLVLISHTLFFIAGFVLILFIGNLISKHGLGNGFCLILGISVIQDLYKNVYHYIEYIKANNINPNYIGFIVLLALLYLLFKLLKKSWVIEIENEKIKSIQIPFFLQGATVITFAASLFGFTSFVLNSNAKYYQLPAYGTWAYALTLSVLTVVSSFFGYLIFSGKSRIAANLAIKKNSVLIDIRPLLLSTAYLFLLSLAFIMPFPFWDQMFIPQTISLFSAIVLISIGLDIWLQWVFNRDNEHIVEICDLDNVYLASMIKDKLNDSKIDHCIQGYHYRRIYFFFQPFIKMKLFVSKAKLQEAKDLIKPLLVGNNV